MKTNRSLIFVSCLALAASFIAGCSKKEPSDVVRQRATERWSLVASQQLVKAYGYLSPGYRATHTMEQYIGFIATSRIRWKSASVDAIKCEEDVCSVRLTVVSTLPGAVLQRPSDMEYAAPLDEKWIRSDGEWFFLPETRIIPAKVAAQSEASQEAAAQAESPKTTPPAADEKEKGDRKQQ